ncbi:MAG TPA: TIGR03435 family protein [Vicinamibacterales bacterium]|nr:TIGR03435 family protein [Vicinamibacterales bacterium]
MAASPVSPLWLPALLAGAAVLAAEQLDAQKPEPAFDAVSIRINKNTAAVFTTRERPDGGFTVTASSAVSLLSRAFSDGGGDMVGVPPWAFSTRLDVIANAVPGRGTPTPEQRRNMTRAMLAERFKLEWHRGTREMPVFDLVHARRDRRLGNGLKKSGTDCEKVMAQRRAEQAAALAEGRPFRPDSTPSSGPLPSCTIRPGIRTEAEIPMAVLPVILRGLAGRPVVDKTGLTGSYHLLLTAVPAVLPTPGATTEGGDVPSVFTAVEEQLGLKLVPSRAILPALFIDRFEPPTEN